MKLKKTIIPLLSILTFSTVLTACGATAASSLTPNLANSDVPSAQVMSVKNTVTPTSNDNGKGNDVVQDALSGGECSDPLEFWEISEYENWMKTELEKNQKLADSGDVSFYAKDANDNYICRAWTQADVDLLYEQWQEQLLRNPIYAQADLDMYEFFKSRGTVVVNEATDFAGTNGCYLYQGRDVQERKNKHLKDQILVLAPSEGLVSSDTWLRCRKKLMANKTFQGGRKAKNTWLAGKVKCGRCGYALMSVGNPTGVQYLRCSKRADSKSCDGCGTLRTREFERFLYGEMVKKLSEFQTLTAKQETVNPKLTALNMELARVEDEIEKLLNTLTGANAVLLSYANSKIEELDTRRQALTKEIAALSAETMSPEQIERLSVYLNQWEEIDFEDRRQVADGLISQIRATDEHVSIEWKI